MGSRLGTKLNVAFGILSLLPLLLMGVVGIYGLRLAHEQNIAAMENGLLRQKQEETKKFLNEISGLFEIKVGYEGTSIIDLNDQRFLLEKLLQENKFISEAAFVDLTGQETAKLSRGQDANLMGLQNVIALPKFTAAKQGKHYFGPVAHTLDGLMMDVAAPVYNRSGEVIMVLTGFVSLTPLQSIYEMTTIGNEGYFYVIGENERIIANSKFVEIDRYRDRIPSYAVLSTNNNNLQKRSGVMANSVFAMSAPIKDVDWVAIVEWPEADAFASIESMRQNLLWFTAAVLLSVMIMGWVIGRMILHPLRDLSAGAKNFGDGKLDFRIKVRTEDEIEELGQVMNKMASDLKDKMTEINDAHKKIETSLKEINKLKDDFIFVAAHELRSPVTVLQGYVAEILEDEKTMTLLTKKNPYFVDMVKGIEVSKNRLSSLVDDLLNVARMEAGKFKVSIKENVDLNESVKPLVESLKELCKPRKITLSFETKGKIPLLKIDPDRTNELLTNLISNAVKYNKDKGKIFVTAEFKEKMIQFEVRDTGIGLDEEEQKHLFEKFWRSEDVSKLQGTGLGLFIVKHMIEQLGGSITFSSKKGVGTAFTFCLPAV
jgi:signal transduction histidine kinase